MKTFIIHTKSQVDREANLIQLLQNYDEVTIVSGVIPSWIDNPADKAMLGCSLSHINIVHDNIDQASILVLENDAAIIKENVSYVLNSEIPSDCGVILMGEWPNTTKHNISKYKDTIYHEIQAPFFGTQAVWYNTKLLKNTDFLINSYKVISSNKVGKDGICLESILMQALKNTGLKIYRPDKMLYTTIESISLRTGTIMHASLSTD
jgi:hypothetical protein